MFIGYLNHPLSPPKKKKNTIQPWHELTPERRIDFTAALISGTADSKMSSMPSQFMFAT